MSEQSFVQQLVQESLPVWEQCLHSEFLERLADGTLDVIATDHAPHAENEKSKSMLKAPFGIVGLETAAALTYSELVDKGFLTPLQMAEKMSYQPARVLDIERGTLAEGSVADLVIFDPEAEYAIDAERFESKGKNTPFHGRKVKGRVAYTVIAGEIVYSPEDEVSL